MGTFLKEEGKGDFVKRWKDAVAADESIEVTRAEEDHQVVTCVWSQLADITPGFAELTSTKEEKEIQSIKDAAALSVATLKHSFTTRFATALLDQRCLA